nr:hypothetical protein [Pseudomonadota bacterium]
QGNWENAARSAGNLSDLWLSRGELRQALAYARQGVDLADRSRSIYQRLSRRATLGYALFHLGCLPEAEAAFREAEAMQARLEPEFPLLYSLAGFRYAELLLAQGRHAEARRRLERIMQWRIPDEFPFVVALKHLGLGLACLEQARQEDGGDYTAAARHLEQAVVDLRLAGQQDELPRGLLARARLRRLSGEMVWARADLDEAMTIAGRAGLKLHQFSGHLEYARWCLAAGRRAAAREHWTAARRLAEALGYRLRDDELRELAGHFRP